MDVFTIIFTGLMALMITDEGTGRAAFVAAPLHLPRVIVSASDVIDASLPEEPAAPGERRFTIAGERITFDGLPAGVPTQDPAYFTHVPRLTRITDGRTFLPEIDRAEPHAAIAGYVDVTGGMFSAGESWPSEVTFPGSRWPGAKCVAKSIVFRANDAADVVQLNTASGRFLRVRRGATIRIENEAPGIHFHMYELLLTDATRVFEPVATGRLCGETTPSHRRWADATHGTGPSCSPASKP